MINSDPHKPRLGLPKIWVEKFELALRNLFLFHIGRRLLNLIWVHSIHFMQIAKLHSANPKMKSPKFETLVLSILAIHRDQSIMLTYCILLCPACSVTKNTPRSPSHKLRHWWRLCCTWCTWIWRSGVGGDPRASRFLHVWIDELIVEQVPGTCIFDLLGSLGRFLLQWAFLV